MNDIIKDLLMIFTGNLLLESSNESSLYEEYDYNKPFRLPRLYHPLFGNTFVYHPGEFKRKDADVYAETIRIQMESMENIEYVVAEATTGPTICKIKLMPFNNIKKAFNMSRQIKYALNREDAKIYAEGSYVVVEIPNMIETVRFGDFMHDKKFISTRTKTLIPIGLNPNGEVIYGDIAQMPHMLVAGSSGSGKSVFLNCIVTALLMKNSPEDIQLFLIDPKMVEFSKYQALRYVHCIYEVYEAINLLSRLCKEMDHRYSILAEHGCKNIETFNSKYPNNKMPRLILVIDELADIMVSSYKKNVESNIIRLAQKARACGIHMILSTQRPCKRQVVFHKLRHLIFQKMRQIIFHSLRHFIFHNG